MPFPDCERSVNCPGGAVAESDNPTQSSRGPFCQMRLAEVRAGQPARGTEAVDQTSEWA